jgi:hypothetical protein
MRAKQCATRSACSSNGGERDALKLKALRAQIKVGVDALDRGDFVEVDDADLDDYLDGLTPHAGNHAR